MELDNIIVALQEDQDFLGTERVIQVDLAGLLDFETYSLANKFSFDKGALGGVSIDPAMPSAVRIIINEAPTLAQPDGNVRVAYSANTDFGDVAYGEIILDNLDFSISAVPIEITLPVSYADLPAEIEVDVREYYDGVPVVLESLDSIDCMIGYTETKSYPSSDYNNDFNYDFGGDMVNIGSVSLNTSTAFWRKTPATVSFNYDISYLGKTATSTITIRKVSPKCC